MCSDVSELQAPESLNTKGEENSEAEHLSPHLRHEMWKRKGYLDDKAEHKHMGKHLGKFENGKDRFFGHVHHKSNPHHHHHHVGRVSLALIRRRETRGVGWMVWFTAQL